VLDPQAPRGGLRSAAAAARIGRLLTPDGDAGGTEDAITLMVEERGEAGLELEAVGARAGVGPAERDQLVDRLATTTRIDRVGGFLFAPRVREQLASSLERLVRDYHAAHPLSEGLPREEARERLFAHAPVVLFERVLADLASRGAVTGRERLAGRGHQLALSPAEAAARDAIERALREAGLKPPDPAGLASAHGIRSDVLARMLALLVRQKVVAKLDGVHFHQAALDRLKAEVRALKPAAGTATVDVATFKQRYDVSRKYAIPLLEYLDRERVTRRVGDARVIL
jgi:selenocysteine-specific elongation factor